MGFEIWQLYLTAVSYLGLLFLVAYATDRGWIPSSLVRHPATYALSLGVYATSWTYYGSVGFAQSNGYNFLTVYLGVTLAFLLSPVLLTPLLRLLREYQLTSLADLFAFRYRSQMAGIMVTLFMLVGTLPYISLQIRAVTESARILSQDIPADTLALIFCLNLTLFAILFGARHITPREKHQGLVAAIAFESLIKLVALASVGVFAVFGVFGGPAGMNQWLGAHPEALEALYRPVREGPWTTLLLLAFSAAFLLPRQFHMTFTENLAPRSLVAAAWIFPLFLLLLNLAIPPILWAGGLVQPDGDPDYYVLGITFHASAPGWLPLFAFVGGVSAASAMLIVTTLALSSMCQHHLLLPASYPDPAVDLYRWLLWSRRMLIAMVIMAGYGFYELLEHNEGLVQLGLISFVAVAQFLPGMAGVLYWQRATRVGLILGLAGGIGVWGVTLLLPLMADSGLLEAGAGLRELQQASDLDPWEFATFWSLAVNTLLFVAGSLATRPSAAEREAAAACCAESFSLPAGVVSAASPEQFKQQLARLLGPEAAGKEIAQALEDLGMDAAEARPGELRRLRERLERNLSGLIGPQLAHMIVNARLQLSPDTRSVLSDTVRYAEERLEDSRSELRGLAAELDALRRFHRQILLDLPLGVCALSPRREVVIWNLAMEVMAGVAAVEARGRNIRDLPPAWSGLLSGVLASRDRHIYNMQVELDGRTRSFNLHKAAIADPLVAAATEAAGSPGQVILFEDLTDMEALEAELAHSERLASIGRLAAGVAHEIGNPVTGIACLAQNLRAEADSDLIRRAAADILGQTRRISDILRSLMAFSHGGVAGQRRERFPLAPLVDEGIRLVDLSHAGRQVRCLSRCPAGLEAYAGRQSLLQVLVNLLTNAVDASRPGDEIVISARARPGGIRLEVRDQGEGIAEAIRERILEPFFTTKDPGEGTGLGLPLAHRIVRDHGGGMRIESAKGAGTRVTVDLPNGPDGTATGEQP